MTGDHKATSVNHLRILLVLVMVVLCIASCCFAAAPKPLKVFILAGQSNMEGQAVADLEGKDYNDGKGTLDFLMRDPAKASLLKYLKDNHDAPGAHTWRRHAVGRDEAQQSSRPPEQ